MVTKSLLVSGGCDSIQLQTTFLICTKTSLFLVFVLVIMAITQNIVLACRFTSNQS